MGYQNVPQDPENVPPPDRKQIFGKAEIRALSAWSIIVGSMLYSEALIEQSAGARPVAAIGGFAIAAGVYIWHEAEALEKPTAE